MTTDADFTVVDYGSVAILTPLNDAAREWCEEWIAPDELRWGLSGYVIGQHQLRHVVEEILDAGFEVRGLG